MEERWDVGDERECGNNWQCQSQERGRLELKRATNGELGETTHWGHSHKAQGEAIFSELKY